MKDLAYYQGHPAYNVSVKENGFIFWMVRGWVVCKCGKINRADKWCECTGIRMN